MKRILVFEDLERALIGRYAYFARERIDVHVKFSTWDYSQGPLDMKLLQEEGFNLDHIEQFDSLMALCDLDFSKLQDFDLYALDGLGGVCFEIIGYLPRERCYIQTGDYQLEEKAKREGYQLLKGEIHDLLE